MKKMKTNFCVVAEDNRAHLCRFARNYGIPPHDVEDLVQDVLLIAHRRWPTFAHRSSPRAWLRGILVRVLSNKHRKSSNYARRLEAYAVLARQPTSFDGEPHIPLHELEAFLASLDERTREVFVKFEIEGYKAREVAEELAVNPNTAVARLRKARRVLQQRFQGPPARGRTCPRGA